MADEPRPKDVSALFQRLVAAATQLNTVSDELGKSIAALDDLLKQLNLGVDTWVTIIQYSDEEQPGYFVSHALGYARVGSKWGIALRTIAGYEQDDPRDYRKDWWPFNDAPRALRIDAVDKLPDLLEALTKAATTTAEKIQDKIGQAQEVVAVGIAAQPRPAQRRK